MSTTLVLISLISYSVLNANSPRSTLQSVVLPTIEFVDVPLYQALDFLQIRSGELSGSPGLGINFILKGGEELRNIPITLNLRDVSLGQALWFIAEIGHLNFSVDQHAVIVSKPDEWEKVPARPTSTDRKVAEKVNQIVIPRVEFSEVPLPDAVDLLRTLSRELDPEKKGINLVLLGDVGEGNTPEISLQLSRIPLAEAIRYTAQLADYEVRLENGAVLLCPTPPKP